jgi:predicted nucleic-acid-binding Zn-ribbon protein
MTHYEKYKEVIKEGVRKARRKRDIWINEYLAEKICSHCGYSETCGLVFYPDNKEIRKLSRSKGLGEKLRLSILEKIQSNKIVCLNCESELKNDIELSPIL